MKIALICDTHMGVRGDSPVFHEYFKKSFEWFFQHLDEKNIKHIIHLGDLFDRRKYINYQTSKRTREDFLLQIENRNIACHIITGNHDIYWKNTEEVNALEELLYHRYSNITTYSKAQEIEISGLKILLVPWITENNLAHTENLIKSTQAEILMGHLELHGFEMYKGMISDHGEDIKIYDKFDLVFSGHYHHKSSRGNIHYLGAFAEHIWSDYKDPRGFTIFDTETRKFEFIQNPYNIFKVIFYDDVKEPDILRKIDATQFDQYRDCYVKIVCINRTNFFAFDILLDKLHKAYPVDVSIIEDVEIISSNDEELENIQDTQSILNQYISGLTLPVNNDKMKSFMKEIYQEAMTLKYVTE
jgi:DNA repair exonuclease SbcCD nuclease subunit